MEGKGQTLEGFMGLTSDELLAMDAETLNHGLAMLARRQFEITQEMRSMEEVVQRFTALKHEARALSEVKSCWQSILRTLRET